MDIIDHARQPLNEWRAGVMTRMLVSALTGAEHLCIFEQFCDPGTGAPQGCSALLSSAAWGGESELPQAEAIRRVMAEQGFLRHG